MVRDRDSRLVAFAAGGVTFVVAAAFLLSGATHPVGAPRGGPDFPAGLTPDTPIATAPASAMTVAEAVQYDLSQPLRDVKPTRTRGERREPPDEREVIAERDGGHGGKPAGRDPVLQAAGTQTSTAVSAPVQNFDGISNVNSVLPPDTNGDVGPNHYVQWVNLSLAVYSKSGALLYGPTNGNTLWAGFGGPCQSYNHGDPIALYDQAADRWMVSQFALPGGASGYHQCIAVSQTPDPTGAWYRYDFLYSATKMNDYPHFGVWPDGYYMSTNQFSGNSWGGQGVAVFERSKMLLGQPARMVSFDLYGVDPNLGGMLPSDLDGVSQPPAGASNAFMEFDDDAWGYSPDQLQIWNFHVDWANTAGSSFAKVGVLPTAAFDSNLCNYARNCIAQRGTTVKLDSLADRLMYRQQYRNFGDHQSLVVNHSVDVDATNHAGIRWYELRNTGSGWSIYQQGTFAPDANQRWMGSAAMNGNGALAVGYSISSGTMYPSIRYTGRLATDALGTLPAGEGTIINGTGAQTHSASRWGDYSMLAVDPTDDCTFWYTTEYVQTTGSAPWRTRIGSFNLGDCGGAPPPSPTPSPTPTPTSAPTPSPTPTAAPTSTPTFQTAFIPPSSASPVTSGAGDNNGYESGAANLLSLDGALATDANSGTGNGTSCTSTVRDKEDLAGFTFGLPGGAQVRGIEVQLRGRVSATQNQPKFCVLLSWDGGVTWTAGKTTAGLKTALTTYTEGANNNTWGRTWAASEFGSGFRVRVVDLAKSTTQSFFLDGVQVRLTYQ